VTCPTGFLRTIDANVPKGLAIHLILDNYATHKHPDVAKWLAKHKRFHLTFHADIFELAQPGRAVVPEAHR
jgi:transposase